MKQYIPTYVTFDVWNTHLPFSFYLELIVHTQFYPPSINSSSPVNNDLTTELTNDFDHTISVQLSNVTSTEPTSLSFIEEVFCSLHGVLVVTRRYIVTT
jgi:hypothetical protein